MRLTRCAMSTALRAAVADCLLLSVEGWAECDGRAELAPVLVLPRQ